MKRLFQSHKRSLESEPFNSEETEGIRNSLLNARKTSRLSPEAPRSSAELSDGERMDSKSMVYRLLHRAFSDLSIEGNQIKNGRVFGIADLFHTVPLQIERADRGEMSYDDILKGLKDNANAKARLDWLEN